MSQVISRAWRAHELTQCEGKERFASADLAHKVARRRSSRGRTSEGYRCNVCGGWHIGGKDWRKADARRDSR